MWSHISLGGVVKPYLFGWGGVRGLEVLLLFLSKQRWEMCRYYSLLQNNVSYFPKDLIDPAAVISWVLNLLGLGHSGKPEVA